MCAVITLWKQKWYTCTCDACLHTSSSLLIYTKAAGGERKKKKRLPEMTACCLHTTQCKIIICTQLLRCRELLGDRFVLFLRSLYTKVRWTFSLCVYTCVGGWLFTAGFNSWSAIHPYFGSSSPKIALDILQSQMYEYVAYDDMNHILQYMAVKLIFFLIFLWGGQVAYF